MKLTNMILEDGQNAWHWCMMRSDLDAQMEAGWKWSFAHDLGDVQIVDTGMGVISDTNLATNLPDLATKRGTLATRLGIWNLATFLATFQIKI